MNSTPLKTQSEAYWRKKLTPVQYRILRESGTEPAFTGKYDNFDDSGTYVCGACEQELFSSDTKYHSGSGWPSFFQAVSQDHVVLIDDNSHGMHRIEVRCANCDSHLGHVFDDGPQPTGQRFCINSAALDFKKNQ